MEDKDFEGLSKDDLIENLKIACKNIARLESSEKLLKNTEKDRINLLKENQELKKEIGKLAFVKELLEKAEVYGYQDIIEGGRHSSQS
jgi:23S rRNA A1618 N6-methylase RlmF